VLWLFGFPDITGFDHLAALPQIEKIIVSMCERLSPLDSLIEMPVPVHGNVFVETAPRELMVRLHARGWNAGHEP